jgi:hypothetical protein
MHSMQTIANSKLCCHVYFFLHVICYTSKLLCCKKNTMVMTIFSRMCKIFVLFVLFVMGG